MTRGRFIALWKAGNAIRERKHRGTLDRRGTTLNKQPLVLRRLETRVRVSRAEEGNRKSVTRANDENDIPYSPGNERQRLLSTTVSALFTPRKRHLETMLAHTDVKSPFLAARRTSKKRHTREDGLVATRRAANKQTHAAGINWGWCETDNVVECWLVRLRVCFTGRLRVNHRDLCPLRQHHRPSHERPSAPPPIRGRSQLCEPQQRLRANMYQIFVCPGGYCGTENVVAKTSRSTTHSFAYITVTMESFRRILAPPFVFFAPSSNFHLQWCLLVYELFSRGHFFFFFFFTYAVWGV